jgi:hypothetical protein
MIQLKHSNLSPTSLPGVMYQRRFISVHKEKISGFGTKRLAFTGSRAVTESETSFLGPKLPVQSIIS